MSGDHPRQSFILGTCPGINLLLDLIFCDLSPEVAGGNIRMKICMNKSPGNNDNDTLDLAAVAGDGIITP